MRKSIFILNLKGQETEQGMVDHIVKSMEWQIKSLQNILGQLQAIDIATPRP